MGIENYVDVAISLETTAISQAGFGTLLIVGPNGAAAFGSDKIRFYDDMDGVAADFATSADEYKAANAAFSQDPKPAKVAIGVHDAVVAGVKTLTLAADLVASNVISLEVNGQAVEVTYAATHQATMTALAAAIQALDDVSTAVLSTTPFRTITITGVAGYPLELSDLSITGGASQTTGAFATTTTPVTIADGLDAIVEESNDWYGLAITSRSTPNILTVADWAEARTKVFGAASSEAGILTSSTTDVASQLKDKALSRTHLWYHADAAEFIEAAIMGKELAEEPGSATWMYKTLATITVDSLTATERINALSKNCNVYTTQVGVNITEQGKMASGQFIDVIHGKDWLEARMAEGVFALKVNAKKIPYTNKGIGLVENVIRSTLKAAQAQGVLTDEVEPTVIVPKVADQSANDRAARQFPGIKFSAVLAGAVHKTTVRGTVTV